MACGRQERFGDNERERKGDAMGGARASLSHLLPRRRPRVRRRVDGTALFIYANAEPKREGVADIRHRDTQFRAILNREKFPLTSKPLRCVSDAGAAVLAREREKGNAASVSRELRRDGGKPIVGLQLSYYSYCLAPHSLPDLIHWGRGGRKRSEPVATATPRRRPRNRSFRGQDWTGKKMQCSAPPRSPSLICGERRSAGHLARLARRIDDDSVAALSECRLNSNGSWPAVPLRIRW